MADQVDVEQALAAACNAALYPGGAGTECAAGVDVRVSRGWPTLQEFNQAKSQGYCILSIATRNGVETVDNAYPREWDVLIPPVRTLTAIVSATGDSVALGGMVAVPQNVTLLVAQRETYSYAVQSNDTLASIATALAALLQAGGHAGASSAGPVVTLPSGGLLRARVGAAGIVFRELGRQNKSFQISLWCPPAPDPWTDADAFRTALAKVIDPALRAIDFLAFPEGTVGRLRYERTIIADLAQEEGLYRRDLFYWVEYPTIETDTGYEITDIAFEAQGGQVPDAAPTVTTQL